MFEDRKENLKYRDYLNKQPLTPGTLRKKFTKYVNYKEIHWKNTELLSRFLTTTGMIKNRWQTRLPGKQQRFIARAIIKARHRLLLPFG